MAITATERTEIEKLIVLMFNAAPGATYLSQVVSIYESLGHNLAALANTLDDTSAYNTLNPNFQTAAEFATKFLTPLGLQADTLAVDFITSKFNAGEPKGQIIYEALQALDGVTSSMSAQYVKAKAILDNKAAVADYYSVTQGVAQTDLNVLQLVLAGVTDTAASVTAAETAIANGTLGVSGIEATLSPQQDTVTGSPGADTVAGLFGDMSNAANNTYTSGDNLDGAGGTDTLNLTVVQDAALDAPVSPTVIVKNFEVINIQDTSSTGATFNEALTQNSPAINFTNTVTGATSKVTNADLASVIGLAGAGNLTVTYANTTGSADTANISLNGASAATVDVSNGNTVEAVKIATAGTNVATLNLGTAAGTITVTGSGTNTFTIGSDKTTATIDASASTGTNTFALGTGLSNGDVVKGGTGADTVSFKANAAIGIVTFTGVETLKGEFDAAALLNLGSSTGIKTITLTNDQADATITKATSDLSALNLTSTGTSGNWLAGTSVEVDYATGQTGNLTTTIGSTSSSAAAISLNQLTVDGSAAFTLTGVGTKSLAITDVNLSSSTTSLTINGNTAAGSLDIGSVNGVDSVGFVTMTAAAGSAISVGGVDASGAADVAVSFNVGAEGYISAGFISAGSFAPSTMSVGAAGEGHLALQTDNGGIGDATITLGSGAVGTFSGDTSWTSGGVEANIGNVTATLASGAVMGSWFSASSGGYWSAGVGSAGPGIDLATYSGSIGNVNVSVGSDGFASILATAQGYGDADGLLAGGGNIGDITVTTGTSGGALLYADASASYSGGGAGNIGNITLNAEGDNSYIYGYVDASGGDVGNVTSTVGHGADVYAYVAAYDYYTSGSSGAAGTGGNIGDFSTSIGTSGYAYTSAYADGNIGTTTVTVEDSGGGYGYLRAGGDIGATTVTGAASGYYYFGASATGDVGSISETFGDNAGAGISGYSYGGNVGDLSVNVGDDSYGYIAGTAIDGNVGNVSLTAGANFSGGSAFFSGTHFTASGYWETSGGGVHLYAGGGGDIGTVNVNVGDDSHVFVQANTSGGGDVGAVTVAGSSSGEQATVVVWAHAVDKIDLSGWLGTSTIDASNTGIGTVILTGAEASTVYGTQGADVITGAAGADYLYGLAGADVINGGGGNDTIDGGTGLDVMAGGTGNDTYYVDNSGDVVNEDSTGGTADVVHTTANWTMGANIESLFIDGSAGLSVVGNSGANTITGNVGNDTIAGGAGVDSMAGGSGADTFVFTGSNLATAVAITAGAVTDVITNGTTTADFVSTTDKLDFATAGSTTNYAENTTAAATLTALLSAADTALDGTVQYYFGVVGSDGYLVHSTDGTNTDAVIKLVGVLDMAYGDIV